MGEALSGVRAGVTEAGFARWRELADGLPNAGPFAVGAKIVLNNLDPTHQGPHDSGRAILHRIGVARVFVPMDMEWAKRVGHLREVQTLLGFPREDRWDVIATVVAAQPGPEAEVIVELGPILVTGQLLLEAGGKVPGLEVAMKELDRLQAHIQVPATATSPEALLPALFKVLETHHWRAFRELYDQAATLSDKKVAFDQFTHAWAVAQGKITFEGYHEPEDALKSAHEGTVIRTRLSRVGEKGEALVRPIKWVKRGASWRLAGGLL